MSSKSSRKRSAVNDYEEDGGFVVNGDASEGESRAKTGKKAKTTGASKIGKEKASSGDDEQYWELSDKRRVSIEKYGGRTLISIREFYDKGGELLPSKKGISLSISQYAALLSHLPALEIALSARGENIERPTYGTTSDSRADTDESTDVRSESDRIKQEGIGNDDKKNYEATSESEN